MREEEIDLKDWIKDGPIVNNIHIMHAKTTSLVLKLHKRRVQHCILDDKLAEEYMDSIYKEHKGVRDALSKLPPID
jgi:hypothetical protein